MADYYDENSGHALRLEGRVFDWLTLPQSRADLEPRLLIDPNLWSKDGTVTLTGAAFSRDGRHLAYAVSEAGSDWQTWHVLDVANGRSCRSAAGQVGTSAVVRRWRPTVKSPMAIKGFHGRMTIAVMAAANSNRGSSVAGRDLSGILPTDYYYTAHECFSVDFRSCQAFPSR